MRPAAPRPAPRGARPTHDDCLSRTEGSCGALPRRTDIPFFLLGSGGGAIATGRYPVSCAEREVTGKLIDNTLVWYINENAEGWNHSMTDMPFVLFGGDGVGLKNRGRIAEVPGTTSNDVWLSIAPLFGMPNVRSFPTAFTGPIPGLFT